MSSIMKSRTAQVTVFIIIGIILLFSIGIYGCMKSVHDIAMCNGMISGGRNFTSAGTSIKCNNFITIY